MRWKTILILALLVLAVVFTAQNHAPATVHFLFWSFAASQALIIFFSIMAGLLLGWLTARLWTRRRIQD